MIYLTIFFRFFKATPKIQFYETEQTPIFLIMSSLSTKLCSSQNIFFSEYKLHCVKYVRIQVSSDRILGQNLRFWSHTGKYGSVKPRILAYFT